MEPSPSTTGTDRGDLPTLASEGSRPPAEAIESALRALQERYPNAPLIAINANGLTAEMPESVPRLENPVLSGQSGLHSIHAEDQKRLIATFDRVIRNGTGECVLHPPRYGEVMWYGFDLRERHGVVVALLGVDADPSPASDADAPREMERLRPPRFATIRKDERSLIIGVTQSVTEILGWTADEMCGQRSLDFIHPDDHALAIENWIEMLTHPELGRRVRQRLRHKDGSSVWFEITNHNLLNDPEHRCVVTEMVDISDEMAAQEALRAREQLLNRLAEAVPVGLFQIDTDARIVYTNDRLHEIVGVAPATTAEAQLDTVVPDDQPALKRAIEAVLHEGEHADIEVACAPGKAGDLRFCTVSFRALRDDDGAISGAIACVADVTEGARMREELKYRATFDELTGCHNRASIIAALNADLERDRRQADRAVMFVDLDGFKSINDRHGHAAGDRLLRKVARLLSDSVREQDLVGRTGGDEFLVICPDVGGADRAIQLAERLADAVRDGMGGTAGELGCTVSIGVAWSSGDVASADSLVAAADAAMYKSKHAGTGVPQLS